ncbi:MAG: delta-60 repeat domain-containing protein [Opitutaceae bacterium]
MKASSLHSFFACVCAVFTVGTASPAVARPVVFREAPPVELPELRAFVAGQRLGFLTDGRVMLGGRFTEVNGENRAGLVRLLSTGEIDPSFTLDPAFPSQEGNAAPWVAAPDGHVYFASADDAQGPRVVVRRLDVSGALDESYELRAVTDVGTEETTTIITALFPGAGGRMLVAGQFTSLGGVEKTNVAQLELDGRVDASFTFEAAGSLERAIALPDGRWIAITTAFEEVENVSQPVRRAYRLLEDGSVDPTFAVHVFPDTGALYGAHAFAVDAARRLVFAEPAPMPGEYRLRLARLLVDGTRDESFAADLPLVSEHFPNNGIAIIWIPPRVSMLVPDDLGGVECVAHFADETFGGVVHVDASGEVSGSKFADAEGKHVLSLTRDPGGAWWGEIRQTISGQQALRAVRFLAGGEVDETFAVEVVRPGLVHKIAALSDGGVVVEGWFDLLNGVSSPGVARLTLTGEADRHWGGWLRPGSVVDGIRILGTDLIEVTGALVTPKGDASIAYLRPDGLPELNIPEEAIAPDPLRPVATASQDGAWLMRRELGVDDEPKRIRRWERAEAPDIAIEGPEDRIQIGDTISLRVPWSGVPVSFQRFVNGGAVPGGENGTFTFTVSGEHDGAVFSVRLGFEDGSNLFLSWRLEVDASSARLVNGSIRAFGARGADTLMVGFVLDGGDPGGLLVRGLGPALADFGVPDPAEALATRLLTGSGGEVLAPEACRMVRDQTGASHPDVIEAARSVGAFFPELGLQSGNDQMLHPGLAPGMYHLQVEARAEDAEGTMLGEVFSIGDELSLRNFSGRARISAQSPLIGGFVIEGDRELRVLIRAIGPGLSDFMASEFAADPALTLHRGAATLAANDDWGVMPAERVAIAEASAQAGAFALEPGAADAALVVSLPPGVYTAVAAFSDDEAGDGLALLEIYVIE